MLRRTVHPDPARDKLLVKFLEIVGIETDVAGADLACFVVNQRLASGRELDQFEPAGAKAQKTYRCSVPGQRVI